MKDIPERENDVFTITAPFTLKRRKLAFNPLGPKEIRIEVKAAGICGTDLEIYDGSLPYIKNDEISYPIVPGHEWCGHVVEIGQSVNNFVIGDYVTGECHDGCGQCEYCLKGLYNLCPQKVRLGISGRDGSFGKYLVTSENTLHHLPDTLTIENATLIEPATIAMHALGKIPDINEKSILILGCGSIGLLCVQIAASLGAKFIFAADKQFNRTKIASTFGADQVYVGDCNDHIGEIMATSKYGKFDVVFEVTGNPKVINTSIELVKPGGTVVLISLYGGNISNISGDKIVSKEVSVKGSMGSPGEWPSVIKMVSNGKISLSPIITHKFKFIDTQKAFSDSYNKKDCAIKVIVDMCI